LDWAVFGLVTGEVGMKLEWLTRYSAPVVTSPDIFANDRLVISHGCCSRANNHVTFAMERASVI
jgi:hypothetical protein